MPFLIASLVLAAVLILLLGKYRYSAIPGFDKVARTDEFEASKLLADEAQDEDVELARPPACRRRRSAGRERCVRRDEAADAINAASRKG